MPKSLRTAFIRITESNSTKIGTVVFDSEKIKSILDDWKSIKYWFIKHESDSDINTPHFHLVIKFEYPTKFDLIKKRFPYGKIEPAKNIKNCIQYLVHFNDPSKKQYSWQQIISNAIQDIEKYKVKDGKPRTDIDTVIKLIDKGAIKEYNQFELIPSLLWSKHRRLIENAHLHFKERIFMDKNRKIEIIFFSGQTGVGKTTLAKTWCLASNKTFCISSSSNDPLQDYKGEDVLILDDLSDKAFEFQDLLKILDNHTSSSAKSRYHNKIFLGEFIIITSVKPLADWYFNESRDDKEQLYRRIRTQYQITKEEIKIFSFDMITHHYELDYTSPNIIKYTKDQQNKTGYNMLEALGAKVTPHGKKGIEEHNLFDVDKFFDKD